MMKKQFLLTALVFLIGCATDYSSRINTDRIDAITTDAIVVSTDKVSNQDIDFLLEQVDFILESNINKFDKIIEEPNKAKQADLILNLNKENLYLDQLRMASLVLSSEMIRKRMNEAQNEKFNELSQKLDSFKRRSSVISNSL